MTNIESGILKRLALLGLEENKLDFETPYWDPWAVFIENDISKILFKEYEGLVSSFSTNANYFCPIPTSGHVLIPVVLRATGLPAITYKKPQNRFVLPKFDNEEKIKKPSRVLLVDTTINTGGSLEIALQQMERIKAEIVGIAVMAYNDKSIEMKSSLINLIKGTTLVYLFTVSELLTVSSN